MAARATNTKTMLLLLVVVLLLLLVTIRCRHAVVILENCATQQQQQQSCVPCGAGNTVIVVVSHTPNQIHIAIVFYWRRWFALPFSLPLPLWLSVSLTCTTIITKPRAQFVAMLNLERTIPANPTAVFHHHPLHGP